MAGGRSFKFVSIGKSFQWAVGSFQSRYRAGKGLTKDTEITEGGRLTESRPLGKVEIDCRKAAPKEEQVGRSCESTERERTSQQCSLGWATEARRQTGNANHPQIAQIFAEG